MPQRVHNSSCVEDPDNYIADIDSTTRNKEAKEASIQSSNMDDIQPEIDLANLLMATLIERVNTIPIVPLAQ
jgi:hypothetical protein